MKIQHPSTSPARLRLRVQPRAESGLRSGHPWLFADSIQQQNRAGTSGELAVIYDRQNRFLAVGLFDPDSPIRVRMLHVGKPQIIDRSWWKRQLVRALQRRQTVADEQTNGFRWIHGESDGFPGLVLDRYADTLVLKSYTAAWLPHLEPILALLEESWQPARIVLRLSRNIEASVRNAVGLADGAILRGTKPATPVIFLESGLHFEADVLRGQKTGFFLDQRENRRRVETLAAGRSVLNAFSFSGGFSLYAARGGARSVTDLDISSHALTAAKRNFALNQAFAPVADCDHQVIQGDAFDWLSQDGGRKVDLLILDPPSLAKRESERAGAIRAYGQLASAAIGRLARAGILVACSCSAHVRAEEFFEAVGQAAARSRRKFEPFETTGHPVDHPATFKEAHYLKTIYLRFD